MSASPDIPMFHQAETSAAPSPDMEAPADLEANAQLQVCIPGLCCAALLARYGQKVTVCEAHYLPGGAAQSFEKKGYQFDAGPSFFAGLSGSNSSNINALFEHVLHNIAS